MNGRRPPSQLLAVGPSEVHVYDIDLRVDPSSVEPLVHLLDDRERAQAARFATVTLRTKYVASHGHLRLALSHYLDRLPSDIQFVGSPHGKPALDPGHASKIRFNLSHSGDKCLIAIAADREIGVDVERIRPLEDWQDIATRFFSERETARLSSLPPVLANTAFFATWSRKEAYIKALGLGLALDLGAFEVEVDPRRAARLLWALDQLQGSDQWCMQDLDVGAEYRAAVAVHGQRCDVCIQPQHWLSPA